jgi:hypothetical protein
VFQKVGTVRADWLVVVQTIDDWATAGRGTSQLSGRGFLFEFAKLDETVKLSPDLTRKRRLVSERYTCQIGQNGIAFRRGTGAFQFFPAP